MAGQRNLAVGALRPAGHPNIAQALSHRLATEQPYPNEPSKPNARLTSRIPERA